jgi:hypothetical protein
MLPAIQLRITPAQRLYLQLLADRNQCSISEALRRLIDLALDTEDDVTLEVEGAGRTTIALRTVLEAAHHDEVELDPEWVRLYGDGQ